MEGLKAHKPILRSLLAEQLAKVVDRLGALDSRLMVALEGCLHDLQAILKGQAFQRDAISLSTLGPFTLPVVQTARMEAGRLFLLNLISQWERKRPYQRALVAIEQYDRDVEELVRTLPEAIPVSGPEAVSVLSNWIPSGWRWHLARLRRTSRSVPLRAVVLSVLGKRARSRAKSEGQYLLALALGLRQLRHPWAIVRDALDASVVGQPRSRDEVEAEWTKMHRAIARLIHQADRALSRWREESKTTTQELARQILSDLAWRRRKKITSATDYRIKCAAHWGGQMRAVNTELRLEVALEQCERLILERFQQALESLKAERASLLSEMDGVIAWLRQQMELNRREGFPPPKADVVPASGRLAEIEAAFKAELESLPQSCETLAKFSALPRRRTEWNRLYPRDTLHHAYIRNGRPAIAQVLEEIESQHRALVQQIERARDVVAFGLEVSRTEQGRDEQVAREAVQNALSLLEFHRREVVDWRPGADARLVQTLASVFAEARLILTRHRLGVLTYLAQQGLRRAVVLAGRSTAVAASHLLQRSLRALERLALEFLVSIGWRPAPSAGKVEVIIRPFLPEEFIVDLSAKELPALYRRLFRFEPLEDPRFLVGRERELVAIAAARSLWETGRPIALIIVGQRGSGKTSLINCALKRPLEGLEVIRGEFCDRLTSEGQLRDFLARLVGADDAAKVEKFLAARRRIIILEELERTFLRQVGYYGAIRALQRVIAATTSSTLWVLSINQTAFRFLDAAIELGASFSHRINVGTANRDDLRQAILLRHNLSGLRLHFAPPPRSPGVLHRLRNLVQGGDDAETLFFDLLARESAGIYRTAFDIWLGQIEAIEAGVLSLKPLVIPDLSRVIDDLDLDDLFTLVAILQHGSLTAEEHATIFQKSVAASRSQLDELLAREIIETDPGRHGFRVRPEAMRVAREALYRRNLL